LIFVIGYSMPMWTIDGIRDSLSMGGTARVSSPGQRLDLGRWLIADIATACGNSKQ